MLQLRGRVAGFIKSHPLISFYTAGTVTGVFIIYQYMKFETKSMELAVYKKMKTGTRPPTSLPGSIAMVPRESVSKEILDLFFPHYEEAKNLKGNRKKCAFGLILGPTGTGKTAVVTDLCNAYPEGVFIMRLRNRRHFQRVWLKQCQ